MFKAATAHGGALHLLQLNACMSTQCKNRSNPAVVRGVHFNPHQLSCFAEHAKGVGVTTSPHRLGNNLVNVLCIKDCPAWPALLIPNFDSIATSSALPYGLVKPKANVSNQDSI